MNVRRLKPSGTVLVAAVALVIGLEAPAMAHQVNVAAHKLSGSSIKVHSIKGNRLKPNTLTGKQIKESTLGTVPKAKTASTLPALKWHPITHFLNGWKNADIAGTRHTAYAVDAQGIVRLRGAISGGTGIAFTLPSGLAPKTIDLDIPAVMGDKGSSGYLQIVGVNVEPADGTLPAGTAEFFTCLEGVSFPAG